MWIAVAESDIYCAECHHEIPSGSTCLSQMPGEMPEGVHRGEYENYCVECEECAGCRGKRSRAHRGCYARRMAGRLSEKVPEHGVCGHCGKDIPQHAWVVSQTYYAWPDVEGIPESNSGPRRQRGTVTGVAAGATAKTAPSGWRGLSSATRHRFRAGGLGRGLGLRSPARAQQLYEKVVPEAIRNLGDPAVREFLKGKHFSHIKSVANSPGRAKAPSNVILEESAANLSRGSRNMTVAELRAARSAGRMSAIKVGAKNALKGGARAGLVSAAMEAVVSVPENILHARRGRKSGGQAAKDAVKDTARAGVIGTAVAIPLKAAGALSLIPFSTTLMVVGGVGVAGITAFRRLKKAAGHDFPVVECRVFFCEDRPCKTRFARDLTRVARESDPTWR